MIVKLPIIVLTQILALHRNCPPVCTKSLKYSFTNSWTVLKLNRNASLPVRVYDTTSELVIRYSITERKCTASVSLPQLKELHHVKCDESRPPSLNCLFAWMGRSISVSDFNFTHLCK